MRKKKTINNFMTYQFFNAIPRHGTVLTKANYYCLLKVAKEGILITNSLCVLVFN